jgi:general secretion pathway protein D
MKLKITILAILTFICGCVTPQKISPSKVEIEKDVNQTLQQLAPLFQGGTKPLLIDSQIIYDPNKSKVSPCVDAKTGKEQQFMLSDLENQLVPVNYVNMDSILSSLQVMGLRTIVSDVPMAAPYTVNSRGQATLMAPPAPITHKKEKYTCSELPIFLKPKVASSKSLTQVLDGPGMRGQAGLTGSRFSFVDMKSTDFGQQEKLIAFYHPEGKERYESIKTTIRKTFDAAPIQVYIESMVLEVNEAGFEKLGVLYKNTAPQGTRILSQSYEIGATSTVTPSAAATSTTSLIKGVVEKGAGVATIADLLSLEIEALVATGSAEVLSRPSVIALNNRPAIIEVTEQKQYPIRQQNTYGNTGSSFTYSFQEVTPGILLQIRPRISDKKNEVAMEIDVQVKALVSGNDGAAVNDDGDTISTKPGSSTRRVHTFAIVPNKTPIIIGGLVSKDNEKTSNKLPWLGDLPYIGNLFGANSSSNEKKEVIVVITPHIIRDNTNPGIQTPKDTAMFDDTGMELFRDSYRIRSEDMFDLNFVYKSKQFKQYRDYVFNRIQKDRKFSETPIARDYTGVNFPGGDALISRMIYDIVGKRNLVNNVSGDRIIITEQSSDGKFKEVTFLKKAWKKAKSMPAIVSAVGQEQKEYGLELKFSTQNTSSSVKPHVALRVLPMAEIALLSETTKSEKDPTRIFIESEKDLKKIRKAIVVREILKLNRRASISGGINEFGSGKKLTLPVIEKTRHFLLDLEVATAYHHIKYYYPILEKSLQESFNSIEKVIEKDNEKLSSTLKIKN